MYPSLKSCSKKFRISAMQILAETTVNKLEFLPRKIKWRKSSHHKYLLTFSWNFPQKLEMVLVVTHSMFCPNSCWKTTPTNTSKRSLINFSRSFHAVTTTTKTTTSRLFHAMPRKHLSFHLQKKRCVSNENFIVSQVLVF